MRGHREGEDVRSSRCTGAAPGCVLQQPHGPDVVLREVVLAGGGGAPPQVQRRRVRQKRHRCRPILHQVPVKHLQRPRRVRSSLLLAGKQVWIDEP